MLHPWHRHKCCSGFEKQKHRRLPGGSATGLRQIRRSSTGRAPDLSMGQPKQQQSLWRSSPSGHGDNVFLPRYVLENLGGCFAPPVGVVVGRRECQGVPEHEDRPPMEFLVDHLVAVQRASVEARGASPRLDVDQRLHGIARRA